MPSSNMFLDSVCNRKTFHGLTLEARKARGPVVKVRCLVESYDRCRQLQAGLHTDNGHRGPVQEASVAWIQEEVMGSEGFHS